MKTKYQDGFLDIRLSKPETASLQKAIEQCELISHLSPLRPTANDLATAAGAAMTMLLKIIGNDAPEVLPLLDNAGSGPDGE